MKQSSSKFPQFSRLFTAFMFMIALVSLVTINRYAVRPYENFSTSETTSVLRNPFTTQTHMLLAYYYKNTFDEYHKNQEILLAKDLFVNNTASVLGASTIATWETEPMKLQEKLSYWQDIIKNHPDYRDAYKEASFIATQLGNTQLAQSLLQKAKALDPSITL